MIRRPGSLRLSLIEYCLSLIFYRLLSPIAGVLARPARFGRVIRDYLIKACLAHLFYMRADAVLVLIFRGDFSVVDDEAGDDAHDERYGQARDREDRSAGQFIRSELERESADARHEDRADHEQVPVVSEIDSLQHLQTADSDEAVQRDARAAHDAFWYRIDDRYERGEEREDHASDSGCHDRYRRGVSRDRDASDRFAVRGVRETAEEASDDGADAVSEERPVEARVLDEVAADDVAEVLMSAMC